jgi:16S rRNA (uracil1498-N3)-methyltransferase
MKKIHHFIIKNFYFSQGQYEISDKEFVHRIKHILKLTSGEKIIIGNGQGQEALTEIITVGTKAILVKLDNVQPNQNEPMYFIRLYCAILKRENFELVIEKATELGVKEIVPLITDRTIKTNLNLKRLEKIAQEASEQCERGIVPHIDSPKIFKDTLREIKNNSTFLFDKTGIPISSKRFSFKKIPNEINLYIGPEGGWTSAEIETAGVQGITIVSFGKAILRAETAATVSCFWASKMLESN